MFNDEVEYRITAPGGFKRRVRSLFAARRSILEAALQTAQYDEIFYTVLCINAGWRRFGDIEMRQGTFEALDASDHLPFEKAFTAVTGASMQMTSVVDAIPV